MPLYLHRGKLLVRDGKLAIDQKCCCSEPGCLCSDLCDDLRYRYTVQGVDCPPSSDPGICETSEVVEGVFTEGDPATMPTPLPCQDPPPARYYFATPALSCTSDDTFTEVACCPIGTTDRNIFLRIGGGTWRIISSGAECELYWAEPSIELSTLPACCGPFVLQVFCPGSDIGVPNCDLAPI